MCTVTTTNEFNHAPPAHWSMAVILWIEQTPTRHRGAHYSAATVGLHNSIRTWLLVIYAADHASLYINHQELTYRFHLFMPAIIYTATVWPCVINILNSNYISSTRHSVLLEQHAFASKMLISEVVVRHERGWKSLNEEERWAVSRRN